MSWKKTIAAFAIILLLIAVAGTSIASNVIMIGMVQDHPELSPGLHTFFMASLIIHCIMGTVFMYSTAMIILE